MNTKYLLSFFLLLVSEYVFATQLVIDDSSSEYYVAPKIGWLVDSAENPSQAMSFSDILALPDGAFNTGIGEKANLNRENDIFWVRFSIKNNSSIDFWFLELAYPRVGNLLLYKPLADGNYQAIRNDMSVPLKQRTIPHHNFIFPLKIESGSTKTYYLRIANTHKKFPLPLYLREISTSVNKIKNDYHGLGLYYGALIIMFLFNLSVYLFLRQENYLYYLLFLSTLVFLPIPTNYLIFNYLWPSALGVTYATVFLAIGLVTFTAAQFSRSFVNLGSFAPKSDLILAGCFCLGPIYCLAPFTHISFLPATSLMFRLGVFTLSFLGLVAFWFWLRRTYTYFQRSPKSLLCVIGLGVIWYLAVYLVPSQYFLHLYYGLFLGYFITVITAVLKGYQKNRRAAFYLLLGWSLFFLFVSLKLGVGIGWINSNVITDNSWMVGALIAIMVFALYLVDDFRAERLAKEKAQNLAIENLQQAHKIKDTVLSNTTNELRTPLSITMGLISQVIADNRLPSDHQRHLQLAFESAHKLDNLIDDIRDASHLQYGHLSLSLRPLNVNKVIEHILKAYKPIANAKGIALISQKVSSITTVLADENRLYQILYNLVGYAIKFTHTGEIVLRIEDLDHNDMVYIRITDKSIEPEQLESVPAPVEEAQTANKINLRDSDIELSVTQQLVALHNGTLSIDSTPGQGNCFILGLPRDWQYSSEVGLEAANKLSQLAMPDANAIKPLGLQQQPFDLLIVDDDDMLRYLIQIQLANSGYHIRQAANVAEAAEQIHRRLPDLILLDVMLPDISGFEYCRKLRQKYSKTVLPVIFITGKHQSGDLAEGFDCGANDYIIKPFSREEILLRVNQHLQLLLANRRLESLKVFATQITALTDKTELLKSALAIGHQHSYAQASVLFHQGQAVHSYPENTDWDLPGDEIDKLFTESSINESKNENYCQILVLNNLDTSHALNVYKISRQASHLLLWRIEDLPDYTLLFWRKAELLEFDTTDFTYLQHIASQIKTHLNSQAQVLAKPNVIEAINTILQYKHILAYVTADAPYCRVHLDNGRTLPLLRIGIDNLNQYFGDKYLLRIHRSYLVNPKFIHSIERHQRDMKLKLVYGKNSALLPVSRKYATNIRNLGVKEVKIK